MKENNKALKAINSRLFFVTVILEVGNKITASLHYSHGFQTGTHILQRDFFKEENSRTFIYFIFCYSV